MMKLIVLRCEIVYRAWSEQFVNDATMKRRNNEMLPFSARILSSFITFNHFALRHLQVARASFDVGFFVLIRGFVISE